MRSSAASYLRSTLNCGRQRPSPVTVRPPTACFPALLYTHHMQYSAFLRAINVGKHNRVKMEELRTLCLSLGFTNVSTYLQTGNIAFETGENEDSAAARIEEALVGVGLRNVAVMVRSRDELLEIAGRDRVLNPEAGRLGGFVTLLRTPLPDNAEIILPPGSYRLVEVRRREVLTVVERGASGSFDLNGFLERTFKIHCTSRFAAVLQEFAARISSAR